MATDPNSASAAYLAYTQQMKVQGGVQYGSTSSTSESRSPWVQYLQALQKEKSEREGKAQETMTEEKGRLRLISGDNKAIRRLDEDIYRTLDDMAVRAINNPGGAADGWEGAVTGIVAKLPQADKEARTAAVYATAWQSAIDAAARAKEAGEDGNAQLHLEAAARLQERTGQDSSPVDYVNKRWPIYTEKEIDEMARGSVPGLGSLDADIVEAKKMAGIGGGSTGEDASSSALTWYMSPYMPARFREVSRGQMRLRRRADKARQRADEAEEKLREARAKHQETALGHVAEAVAPAVAPEPAVEEPPYRGPGDLDRPLADAAPPRTGADAAPPRTGVERQAEAQQLRDRQANWIAPKIAGFRALLAETTDPIERADLQRTIEGLTKESEEIQVQLDEIEAFDEALVAERERLDAILAEGGSAMTQKEREMLHPPKSDPSLARQKEKAELWRLREEEGLPGQEPELPGQEPEGSFWTMMEKEDRERRAAQPPVPPRGRAGDVPIYETEADFYAANPDFLAHARRTPDTGPIPRPEGVVGIGGGETLGVVGLDSPMPANVRKAEMEKAEHPEGAPASIGGTALNDEQRAVAMLIYDMFTDAGLPESAAYAAIVNAHAESTLNPDADTKKNKVYLRWVAAGSPDPKGPDFNSETMSFEDSVGLFQLNAAPRAMGAGMSDAERRDPIKNIERMIEAVKGSEGRAFVAAAEEGASVPDLTAIFTEDLEKPQNAAAKGAERAKIAATWNFGSIGKPPVEQAAPAAQPPVPPGGRAGDAPIYETRADLYAANPDLPAHARRTTTPPTPAPSSQALMEKEEMHNLFGVRPEFLASGARSREAADRSTQLMGRKADQAALTDDELLADSMARWEAPEFRRPSGIEVDKKTPAFSEGRYDRHRAATGAPPSLEMTERMYMDVLNSIGAGSDEEARATMLQIISDRDDAKGELQGVIGQLQNRPKMRTFASGIEQINIDPSSPGAEDLQPMRMSSPDMRRLSERREELTHKVNFLKGLADFVVDPEFIKQTDEDLLRDATFNGR